MIRLYLAGPEVFHRDALQLGMAKQLMCARFHYQGLYPFDGAPSPERRPDAAEIYERCLGMIHASDAGIFNLTPFRGPSADVGTVLELGIMAALGKPCFAYTHAAEDLIDRLRAAPGLTQDDASGTWRDADGMSAEDFGFVDNLMLDRTLAAQGRKVHRVEVPRASRFTRLDGFVACLEEVRRALPPAHVAATGRADQGS